MLKNVRINLTEDSITRIVGNRTSIQDSVRFLWTRWLRGRLLWSGDVAQKCSSYLPQNTHFLFTLAKSYGWISWQDTSSFFKTCSRKASWPESKLRVFVDAFGRSWIGLFLMSCIGCASRGICRCTRGLKMPCMSGFFVDHFCRQKHF